MSLEKKRRAIGNLERSVILALDQDPFVALDDRLIASGLMPAQGDPLTGGWGRTTEGPSALRLRAQQVAELAAQGIAAAHAFRTGESTAEQASADIRAATSAIEAPFDGFKRTSYRDPGAEPHSSTRERKWDFEGGELVLSMKFKGKWVQVARYRPEPGKLGVPAKVLPALGVYEDAWRERDEQTAALEAALDKVTAAWKVHPAKKVADQHVIAMDSPAAAELQRATKILSQAQKAVGDWKSDGDMERLGWRRSPTKVRMFEGSAPFKQVRGALDKSLVDMRADVPPLSLNVGGSGKLPRDSRQAGGDPEQQMEIYSRSGIIDSILGHIEDLYQRHPVRRRFDKIMEAVIEGGAPMPTDDGLGERVQALEDLYTTSGIIAHDFSEARLDFAQAKARLERIRNELAAIDGSFDPSSSAEPIDQICATVMAAPPRFSKQEHRPIRIDDHRALAAMTAIEGTEWLAAQLRDRREPTGYLANRDAWSVLRDLGPDAKGLTVGHLLDDGGTIHGLDGRLYEVRPDGRIALLATSTDDQAAEAAEQFGLLVT
jgi:hypothetical protein